MPRIFDNIEKELLPALQETLEVSDRSDFCVGYFNLRGWKKLDSYVEQWSGQENSRCRLLVGMQRLPAEDLREWLSLIHTDQTIDNQTALRLKKKLAEEFRIQLTFGVPTNEDRTLMKDLKRNSCRKTISTRDGDEITYAEFDVSKSKPILDEIDQVLAQHYGFTAEETDFIINYDIKYRMGLGGEAAEE